MPVEPLTTRRTALRVLGGWFAVETRKVLGMACRGRG
jgi:hypothetical protein